MLRNNVVRRSLAVLGATAAAAAGVLSPGTPAFAKSDMAMKADHKTVKTGQSIRFTGEFGDDYADGVNGDQVCLWQYAKGAPVRQLAPCAPRRRRNGKPLKPDSYDGYFTVVVTPKTTGRLVVVPVVRTSYSPKSVYRYAQVTVLVTGRS